MRKAFAAMILALAVSGCTINSGGGDAQGTQEQLDKWKEQVDAFDKQTERARRIQERQDELTKMDEENLARYGSLLSKWEDQARRMDAVIEAKEREAGIKKGATPAP